jgi:chloramphenicol 3-O-phosphotransferase
LKNHQVYYVKVFCKLPIMEEREILRSDRARGLARDQFFKMEKLGKMWEYDIEIDTTNTNSFANAKKILEFMELNEPRTFIKNT